VTCTAGTNAPNRFDGMSSEECKNLRPFLKFVQETTRASRSESSDLQLVK
jgi:hypothetical protein